ncbi:MAG: oligopeptide transporter, OPT family [Proteobacteria bacterium]|jgi:putative OPT family oligopeptide transporter|nr:oligopeptide transporter, OPT family [Pseudomonadota bacterium]
MHENKLEFTIKALIIGLVLAVVFCGANVYLGLKIGNTVSASVPSAVLAMGFLRLFKKYSTLENSIAQTTASVGESMSVAVIFVFPALLILNVWSEFNYLEIILVIAPGAVVGVIYSIILRKVLLNDKQLGFPEGQAIGKVLQATENLGDKAEGRLLAFGMVISSVTSFCQIGLQVLSGGISKAFVVGNRLVGGGVSFSIAIMGAGYLVGFAPMFVAFLSLLFAWFILLPIFSGMHGIKDINDIVGSAFYTWKNYIRPIGVGVFIFTGFATIAMLMKPIMRGIRESAQALKNLTQIDSKDKDLNIVKLLFVIVLACIPVVLLIVSQLRELNSYSVLSNSIIAVVMMVILLIVGFAIAAVAGYFAGLAGSTSSPVSGLLFIAVIVVSLMLGLASRHGMPNLVVHMLETILLLVGFIGGTSVITNGSIQDFKSGQIVGSTPYKQQTALFIGVVISVLVAPLFITLIFNAYGIAGVVPHVGMDPNKTLSAPQASAVAALTQNIIGGSQDWSLIAYGILIGAIALILDVVGRKTGKFRCSMVSVGMGIYLPPDVTVALFIGGCLRSLVMRAQRKISKNKGTQVAEKLDSKVNLLVCGLIAGESLMGLILAIPFVIYQSSDALRIVGDRFSNIADILSVIVSVLVLRYVYKTGTKG